MATRKPRLLRDSEILRAAMQAKQGAEALEREAFQRAADWAIAHVVADEMDAAVLVGTNCEVSIAGPGAPMVSEYCCDEIAAALGMSTDAERYYVGHALEACCRLPRLWARLVNGEVTVAQVRRITEQTMVLSALAADRADQLLAAYAHSVGRRAIEHAINLAEQQVDPDIAVLRQQLSQDDRRFDVAVDQPSLDGTVDVHGRMDREDAIDLDAALAGLAHQALAFGSEMSLDARRAWAAGQLGREHLDLCGDLDKLDHRGELDDRTESLVEPVETPAPSRHPSPAAPQRVTTPGHALDVRLDYPGAAGERGAMRREPHENVATVLVDPSVLRDLEVHLGSLDLWVWPVATAPVHVDGPRAAFQVRRRMLAAKRGAWDDAAHFVPVWIAFGESWQRGSEPLPWAAHRELWDALETYGDRLRYRLGLGGIPRLSVPREASA